MEIKFNILEHIYKDDDILKTNLEDESMPDFYKRFIIQDKIKKYDLLEKKFMCDYKGTKKIRAQQLSDRSRKICKNDIDYEPKDKRLDKIIKKKENNIEEKIKDIEKYYISYKSKGRKKSWKKTEEWLINMDKWNTNKILKIKQNKEEIEKEDFSNLQYYFKPHINKNAHIKK